jgi:hypothetical protein
MLCPRCMSMSLSVLFVHVLVVWPCPCCVSMPMFMLHIYMYICTCIHIWICMWAVGGCLLYVCVGVVCVCIYIYIYIVYNCWNGVLSGIRQSGIGMIEKITVLKPAFYRPKPIQSGIFWSSTRLKIIYAGVSFLDADAQLCLFHSCHNSRSPNFWLLLL